MSLRRSGLLVMAALATATGSAQIASAQQGDPPVGNLATRYNLVERFTTQENRPGYVGQYQVAFSEKITSSEGKSFTRTTQFSERPASVPDDRRPTELVRHYDYFTSDPPVNDKGGRRLLDDLTVWCRELPGKEVPLVISLTPNRPLQDKEYDFVANNNYVTKLTFVLSSTPVRLADGWKVGSAGTFALTALPDIVDGTLTATLADVHAHPSGAGQQAVVKVTGHLRQEPQAFGDNDTAFTGELLFAFTPTAPLAPGGGNVLDAFGQIEKLRLTQRTTFVVPAPNPPAAKKERWLQRELRLERRFPGKDAPLTIPEPPPTATVENSWLTASAPNGEFHVRHPQEFEVKPGARRSKEDEMMPRLRLEAPDPGGSIYLITFDYYKTTIRPEAVFDQLKSEWTQQKIDVIPGLTHRLPETDWPGLAVHHMEVGLKLPALGPEAPAVRRYSDYYVVQFARTGSIVASASTFSDNHEAFRKQVEAILKTLKLGPPPA